MVLKGEFDLIPGHSEDEVRSELGEVYKTKFKLTTKFRHKRKKFSDIACS